MNYKNILYDMYEKMAHYRTLIKSYSNIEEHNFYLKKLKRLHKIIGKLEKKIE